MNTEISPNDGMFKGNRDHYFGVGASALHCVQVALRAAGKTNVASILDMPSGHGRVLRALTDAFPQARVTACDLDRDGVDFCARALGATPVYSTHEISKLALQQHDLIWCGSLLTHLSLPRCQEFLQFFRDHLNPGGVMVFTTHGRWPAQRIAAGETGYGRPADLQQFRRDLENEGFAFFPYDFAPYAGQDPAYGVSVAQPWKAVRMVQEIPSLSLIGYHERGWDNHQDVVAVQRL
jgi:SAM-dependent methyltransferase